MTKVGIIEFFHLIKSINLNEVYDILHEWFILANERHFFKILILQITPINSNFEF